MVLNIANGLSGGRPFRVVESGSTDDASFAVYVGLARCHQWRGRVGVGVHLHEGQVSGRWERVCVSQGRLPTSEQDHCQRLKRSRRLVSTGAAVWSATRYSDMPQVSDYFPEGMWKARISRR